jgi:hypothetical protein
LLRDAGLWEARAKRDHQINSIFRFQIFPK